ncbi:MAG: ATP-dependent DNA helicase RecG [Chloroflexi bacterium]|nr:ATP-dependent DNA helicase RecG [Chloroflexota bacterium]|tara:strand:- start:10633 stop:13041 length:2409 start_codon:yes stop_codon:yes gene_type:complete
MPDTIVELKKIHSILMNEYENGLNDESVEQGLDAYLNNLDANFYWVKSIYPLSNKNYKNLGIGERHIWIKNSLAKIQYETGKLLFEEEEKERLENISLETPVDKIPFIPKRFINKFPNINIFNLLDLIYHFPYRYEDYTNIRKIIQLKENDSASIIGEVKKSILLPNKKGPRATRISISDGSGYISATWFRQPYLIKNFKIGSKVALAGKVTKWKNYLQFDNPYFENINDLDNNGNTKYAKYLLPYYHSTQRLPQLSIRKAISMALKTGLAQLDDFLPNDILKRNNLFTLKKSVLNAHFPKNNEQKEKALKSFAFHEFFLFHLSVKLRKKIREETLNSKPILNFESNLKKIINFFPYELTMDQKKSLKEIGEDLSSNVPMARLLQGEVGSGKTIIALLALICTSMENHQGILLAPTEVLSEQHFMNICNLLGAKNNFGTQENIKIANIKSEKQLKIGLLTGSLNEKLKYQTRKLIEDHEIDIIIGTHALLNEDLSINNSGLVVIDEQQRFGVQQRTALLDYDPIPNMLAMSATPIPRTLALTVYGDLSLSTIKTLPIQSRASVDTIWLKGSEGNIIFELIEKEIEKKSQVFYVCPFIENSDVLNVASVVEEFEKISKSFLSKYKIGLLHGKMKMEEKQRIMEKLRNGDIDILVTTPIIEVGVDIHNATLMIIYSANRFGISQLHQLRGRIGRGEKQGKCILYTDEELNEFSEMRLNAIVNSNDGFQLSEKDLKIRGPGEIERTKQSGWPEFSIADPSDINLIESVNKESEIIIKKDPDLISKDNALINKLINKSLSNKINLS